MSLSSIAATARVCVTTEKRPSVIMAMTTRAAVTESLVNCFRNVSIVCGSCSASAIFRSASVSGTASSEIGAS